MIRTSVRWIAWPGSIRELQSVLREALIASTGSVLLPQFLPPELQSTPVTDSETVAVQNIAADDWTQLGVFIESALDNRDTVLYRRASSLSTACCCPAPSPH